ncbi:MAG: site-2 protease family protein [Patescibacteria group bacterium]|nr:site-2 protease family protein [Patescibacteria group bacterium]MDE1966049.1 site-2 protease family protein [Patescibacteria group bacterium]
MQLTDAAFTIIVLIFSVIIHEVAHGYAAYALGDPTAKLSGRLTLNPLRHIDPMGSVLIPAFLVLTHSGVLFGWAKPVPYNPYNLRNQRWGEAVVAGAGAASNLFLAVLFALFVRIAAATSFVPQGFVELAVIIIFANLFLGLFNLIPFPPMDGYTVLRGILPYRAAFSLRAFEERIRGLGALGILLVLIVFVTVFSGPFFLFVSWIFGLLVGG